MADDTLNGVPNYALIGCFATLCYLLLFSCVVNGGTDVKLEEKREDYAMENYKRLYRSNHDIMIAGVASGLAEYFNIDPTIVRLMLVLLSLPTFGAPMILIYLALWIIMPRNPGVSM